MIWLVFLAGGAFLGFPLGYLTAALMAAAAAADEDRGRSEDGTGKAPPQGPLPPTLGDNDPERAWRAGGGAVPAVPPAVPERARPEGAPQGSEVPRRIDQNLMLN